MTSDALDQAAIARHFSSLNAQSADEQNASLEGIARESPELAKRLGDLLDAARAIEDKTLVPYRCGLLHNVDSEIGRVGQYEITGLVGSGGMASVYAGERVDGRTHQNVAIKIVHRGMTRDPGFVQRFIDERKTLSTLQHPNIARIIDADELEDGRPYMIMDFVSGERVDTALKHVIRDQKFIKTVVKVLIQVSSALEYAHQKLIVHGDVKPSNVLLDDDGGATLIDFGISVSLKDQHAEVAGTGASPFTRAFASPEQRDDQRIDVRSDVYSFGALALYLLSEQVPTRRDHCDRALSGAMYIAGGPLPSENASEQMAPLLKEDIDSLVSKCLHEDPERRYGSMARVREDLIAYLEQRPLTSVSRGPIYRWRKFVARNQARLVLSTVVLTALGALSVSAYLQSREVRRQQAIALGEYEKAASVSRFMMDSLRSVDQARTGGRNLMLREFMYQTMDSLNDKLTEHPQVRAELVVTIGEVLLALSDYEGVERLILDAGKSVDGVASEQVNLAARWAIIVASLQTYQDNDEGALKTLLGAEAHVSDTNTHLRLETNRINALSRVDQLTEASRRSAQLVNTLEVEKYTDPEHYIQALIVQARVAFRRGDIEERTQGLLKAKQTSDDSLEKNHPLNRSVRVALVRSNISAPEKVTFAREAVEIARQLDGEDNILYSGTVNALGTALRAAGEFDAAVEAYREVHDRIEIREGKVHGAVARIKFNLASALVDAGRREESFEEFRACLVVAEAVWPSEHHYLQWFGSVFGMHLNTAGQFEEAVQVLEKVHAIGLNPNFQQYDAYMEGGLALAIARFALEKREFHIERAQDWLNLGGGRDGEARRRVESQVAVGNRLGMGLSLVREASDP